MLCAHLYCQERSRWKFKKHYPNIMVLSMRFPDQQPQYFQEAYQNANNLTSALQSQKHQAESQAMCSEASQVMLMFAAVWEARLVSWVYLPRSYYFTCSVPSPLPHALTVSLFFVCFFGFGWFGWDCSPDRTQTQGEPPALASQVLGLPLPATSSFFSVPFVLPGRAFSICFTWALFQHRAMPIL